MFNRDILRVLLIVTISIVFSECHKKTFTAQVVEDIVQNEIAKKMPAAMSTSAAGTRGGKKKSLTGVHLKEATDAINKLVDESIVDRVQEAEKEVSQMLLKSIEHHIQDAGKVLLKQDENTCRDKLDSCETLAEAGVCESSKDAMVNNCPMTCNFCGMLEDLKNEAKSDKSKEKDEKDLLKIKKKRKHKKIRKHKKRKHHLSVKSSNLAPEEVRLIHENMLDQTIDHANLPMTNDEQPTATEMAEEHQASVTREFEADEAAAKAEEDRKEQEREQEELEREKEKQKKKKAMHKSYKAPQADKGNYLPPNPAGMDPITPNIQAMQAEVARVHDQNAYALNQYQPQTEQQTITTDMVNPIQPVYSQYTAGVPSTMDATKRNDFTETTEQLKGINLDKPHNKVAQKTLIDKLLKVDLKHSKSKTDIKLKHEIETMVDKAFGELLLKKKK